MANPSQTGGNPEDKSATSAEPPKGAVASAPPSASKDSKDLSSSYTMAQINQSFKSDRAFHSVVSSKTEFHNFLGLVGKIPFSNRGQIARNLGAVIELNPRLLQDTKVFESINTILKNLPNNDRAFQETTGKMMLKIREALIKNRAALNLSNPIMAEYSGVIQKFLALVATKPKNDFFSSLDEEILNFILGKISKAQKEDKEKKREKEASKAFEGDDTDDEPDGDRMQRLVKMLFSDVMRLEPDLVSAVILSLVTQLPHGNMVIEDKKLLNNWMRSLSA